MPRAKTAKAAKRQQLTSSPALLFATLISARKSGDEVLAEGAKFDLLDRYGVTVEFAGEKESDRG